MALVRRPSAYALCQLLGWGAYGAVIFAFYSSETPLLRMFLHSVVYCSAGAGLTHLLRRRIHTQSWSTRRPLSLAWRVVLSSVALAVALVAVTYVSSFLVFRLVKRSEFAWMGAAWLTFSFFFVFFCWQLIYFVVHALDRARRAEVEKWQLTAAAHEAELRFLRGQMHPHFLFNCLNSLRAMILEDPPRAQAMVTQLAGILRHSLSSDIAPTVPLERELEVVRDYLALEAVRLEERLRVKMDVSVDSLRAPVPAMLVQTLVENAIKHGVAKLPRGGEVVVAASVADSELQLRVESPLVPGRSEEANGTGVGLANARARLRLLFGERASLSLDALEGERATAQVRIPLVA